jgi:hypothetical protein
LVNFCLDRFNATFDGMRPNQSHPGLEPFDGQKMMNLPRGS